MYVSPSHSAECRCPPPKKRKTTLGGCGAGTVARLSDACWKCRHREWIKILTKVSATRLPSLRGKLLENHGKRQKCWISHAASCLAPTRTLEKHKTFVIKMFVHDSRLSKKKCMREGTRDLFLFRMQKPNRNWAQSRFRDRNKNGNDWNRSQTACTSQVLLSRNQQKYIFKCSKRKDFSAKGSMNAIKRFCRNGPRLALHQRFVTSARN